MNAFNNMNAIDQSLSDTQQDGYALQYVHNQDPEICMAAVQQNGRALQYVHNQIPEICLAALQSLNVKTDVYTIERDIERISNKLRLFV